MATPIFTPKERETASADLLTADKVVLIPRKPVDTPHGMKLVSAGEPVEIVCGVEGRQNQAGMFANSGQEDTPQKQGGLTEITPIQIIAKNWPGDIWSAVWFDGDEYDTVGSPVQRRHGTEQSRHWEIRAELKRRNRPKPQLKGEIS
ncbi:MAG: hypothetical protein J6575_03490 [Bifidobacterium sp.]|nr:hypothetical protein [Bifidobacterium sp.]